MMHAAQLDKVARLEYIDLLLFLVNQGMSTFGLASPYIPICRL